ncbi:MAG TPA: hypothetical protein VJJ81_01640, partial [Candidatus Babeliales bacterium]|nr:hypothetical protein [Candidatus Babeliales bacterium]
MSYKSKILYFTIIIVSLLAILGYFTKLNRNVNHDNNSANSPYIAKHAEATITQALINDTIKNICKRETIIPKFSTSSRLVREVYEIASEVTMYHA